MVMPMPSDGSAYTDPSFVKDVTKALLLPTDHKRLVEIGLVQSAEWSLAHAYQVRICMSFLMSLVDYGVELVEFC